MKQTILHNHHVQLGAKMTDFAGFQMPLVYSSVQEEHMAVRQKAGLFDVSHMGEFIVRGKQALQLVQSISSNDASKLEIGQAQYSCIPNEDGGIVDDMIVYRLPEDMSTEEERVFLLVVNASNIEKDFQWIADRNQFDCRLINISEDTGLLALQGPEATTLLQNLADEDISDIPYYHFKKMEIGGCPNILVSGTGYTGSGGFELYGRNDQIIELWEQILALPNGVMPCGLGARDTLRLEMGYSLYGQDITDKTSPIEAGLSWITKTKKESAFPSQSIFQQQKKEGGQSKTMCLYR